MQLLSRTKKKINCLVKITAVFTEGRKEGNEQNVLPEIQKCTYFSMTQASVKRDIR